LKYENIDGQGKQARKEKRRTEIYERTTIKSGGVRKDLKMTSFGALKSGCSSHRVPNDHSLVVPLQVIVDFRSKIEEPVKSHDATFLISLIS
jgi:hypothetical protein